MKKLILFVTLILVACTTPAPPVIRATATTLSQEFATETQTKLPAEMPTDTPVLPAPTETLVNQSTVTSQPPATCPTISNKAKLPLNPVFKDKKAPYHDARDVVLNYLNQGGDPKIAIEKLSEFNIRANTWDLTNDGVPEFILPSGYWTVFGCYDGKYISLLDLHPSEWKLTAVPLAIEDINQNGMLELLIGQVDSQDKVTYKIFEWDGTRFANLLPANFVPEDESHVYIADHIIYAIGQSNAEKGAFEGNWEIQGVGNGPKRIVFRAGVFDNYISTSDLEKSLILMWNSDAYVVAKVLIEDTPTPLPTSTPLPFSATCANRAPELRFQKPDDFNGRADQAVLDFLNAGGNPEQLKGFYRATIQDLNNDTAPEVILIDFNPVETYIMMFTCRNGKYGEVTFPDEIGTFEMNIMAVKDNNKNGFPEVFVKDIGCLAVRCGALYVVEWDGNKFVQRINDPGYRGYAPMDEPQDAYLSDVDHDGIAELIWRGELAPSWHADRWEFYPQRLATHTFKWDGENYTAQMVEYGPPDFRFQAVQDGDRYSEAGIYEKALEAYQKAITSSALKWWTEDLYNYTVAPYGIGPCAENLSACPTPTANPNERPVLSAYASFRKMLVHLLMNDSVRAESTYQNLLTSHPDGTPGYKVSQMATLFWEEYQSTRSLESACNKFINNMKANPDILTLLTGSDNGQGINYENDPGRVCPFK